MKTNQKTEIVCSCCGGTGRAELPIHLQAILAILRAHPEGLLATEIAKIYCNILKHPAMNNRLMALYRLKLVKKVKDGRAFIWRAA